MVAHIKYSTGSRWLNRENKIVEILSADICILVKDHRGLLTVLTLEGRYHFDNTINSPHDLIKLVMEPI